VEEEDNSRPPQEYPTQREDLQQPILARRDKAQNGEQFSEAKPEVVDDRKIPILSKTAKGFFLVSFLILKFSLSPLQSLRPPMCRKLKCDS
jgi:hypothetical protein